MGLMERPARGLAAWLLRSLLSVIGGLSFLGLACVLLEL